MPIVPMRGVGSIGLSADRSPYDLNLKAWTDARNVRFSNQKVAPYSAFKEHKTDGPFEHDPVHLFETGTPDRLAFFLSDGSLHEYETSTGTFLSDLSPSEALNAATGSSSVAYLGGVTFFNSSGSKPVYRSITGGGTFQPLPGWSDEYLTRKLVAYGDFLFAVNVTKGAAEYRQMVKWSDAVQFGSPPPNWSVTDDASLSGETIINDVRDPITDAETLSDSLIIYTESETIRCDYIGGAFLFDFNTIFRERGAISDNCVATVDGRHYVFGKNDIYVHDGSRKKSLSADRVDNRIFGNLNFKRRDKCFVHHDEKHNEIIFAFPSTYRQDSFPEDGGEGCNEAAVYNYSDDTWTIIDLPYVTSIVNTLKDTVSTTWVSESRRWDQMPANWTSQESLGSPLMVAATTSGEDPRSEASFRIIDDHVFAASSNAIIEELQTTPYVERVYSDLDEVAPDLAGTKRLNCLIPQVTAYDADTSLRITLGSARSPFDAVQWEEPRLFHPADQYKHDSRVSGRYLNMRIEFEDGAYSELSSFDMEIMRIAKR